MLISAIALAAVLSEPVKPLACPVMGGPVAKNSSSAIALGARFGFCCPGCEGAFRKDPARYVAARAAEGKTVGLSLTDPVSRRPVAPGEAVATLDREGIRYPFLTVANRDRFAASRPAASKKAAKAVVPTTVTKAVFGNYDATLRLPDGGLYAGEETDVEFRVVDRTKKDPVETGFKGVGGISATAVMTMPSMQGMPEARPKVHREGVPGDYGIELFFPHGGDYRIDLNLDIPGIGVRKAAFLVDVKDERPASAARPQPYRLDVVDWPATASAGTPTPLRLRVTDTKTGATQKEFDLAHEKRFHLLIASADLNWFAHEHPEQAPDGTWTISQTFPAGGEYGIYGDVAPSGQGSRILVARVKVAGEKPGWDTALRPSSTGEDGGLKGVIGTLAPIEVGRKATVQVKLYDAKTGTPATDTVKWLGAAGHLMIFHRDGRTVVHSHPAEDAESVALAKRGVMRFSGRFPKPGLYKVYAQFDWRGAVRTLPFAIDVR